MRYFEIASSVRLPVSFEEQAILTAISDKTVSNEDLNERQQELARLMLSRGLLRRITKSDQIYYKVNSVTDIWRGQNDD